MWSEVISPHEASARAYWPRFVLRGFCPLGILGRIFSRAESVWLRVAFQLGQVRLAGCDSEIEPHRKKQSSSAL